jgi:hypothetical protein
VKNFIDIIKALFLVIEIYIFSKGAKNKMKNLSKWFKSNKGAIVSLLTFVLSISDLLFNWILGENTIYVLGFNLVGVLGVAIALIIAVFTSGFSSAKVQEVIDKAKNQLKLDANNGLSYEERVKIGKKINALQKKKAEIKKENQAVIDNVEVYNIPSNDDAIKYENYKKQTAILDGQIKKLRIKLGEIKEDE